MLRKTHRVKKYEWPERHIKRVDFQRIENAPLNRFEKEIQKAIALGPNPLELLIKKEETEGIRKRLKKAIRFSRLSSSERKCVNLFLKGLRPVEIGKALGICDETVATLLSRAMKKLNTYMLLRNADYKNSL